MIAPRIIPRDELRGSAIEVPRATDPARTCERPITLGGRRMDRQQWRRR
jgi:hypothetical protein